MPFLQTGRGIVNLKTIGFLGDSMMIYPDAGAGVGPDAWPYITGPARGFTNTVISAVVGETAAQIATRLDLVLRHRPGVVAIMCGTNDAAAPTDTSAFEATVRSMVDKCQSVGARVTLCTPALRRDEYDVEPYAEKIRTVAGDTSGVVLFDVNARFDTYDSATLDLYYLVDDVHFSSLGAGAIRDMALEPGQAAAFRVV